MTTELYVGRRLSFEGSLCTVRYVGVLDGLKGEWLGVEWDDDIRGKHSGNYKGQQIFSCLSKSATAASFIKTSRKPDLESTLLQAIRRKYGESQAASEAVIISGKVAEEVGFDKISQEQSQLAHLRIVVVDALLVSGISPRHSDDSTVKSDQGKLLDICPNITELDIGYNLIETWQNVINICVAAPKLRTLRASGSRFRAFDSSVEADVFPKVNEIYLEYCLLASDQIIRLLRSTPCFGSIQVLHLSGNQLDVLFEPKADPPLVLSNLKSLVLDNNLFTDLTVMSSVLGVAPNLRSVSLQANQISQVGSTLLRSNTTFKQLSVLNLADNMISSYQFLDDLARILPNLDSLRVSGNPIYQQFDVNDARASDKSFYLTLARLPTLKTLNHGTITARDRQEGELYYLAIAENDFKQDLGSSKDRDVLIAKLQRSYPSYEVLCEKYSRSPLYSQTGDASQLPSIADSVQKQYPAGSLGARLVKATFYLAPTKLTTTERAQVTLDLPNSIAVTQVTSQLMRQAKFRGHLKPMQFRLIYETNELDPVDSTAESTTRSATYGKNLSAEEKAMVWKEWGDWDADAVQEDTDAMANGVEHVSSDGQFYIKDGRKWKRREVEIPLSLKRPWGDWLDDALEVTIRIEPWTR